MKKLLVLILLILTGYHIHAQNVGINTISPDTSAMLDVYATNKGFLMPRLTTSQMNAIAIPASGLIVYNTDSSAICIYTGSAWKKIAAGSSSSNYFTASASNIYNNNSGNVGIGTSSPSYKLQVSGTAAADSINTSYLKMTNGAASGYVLQSDASGNGKWVDANAGTGAVRYIGNSYLGKTSGYGSTGASEGSSSNLYNIYIGDSAGNNNTTGTYNIGLGYQSAANNTTGIYNTSIGHKSFAGNTTGSSNTALGAYSLNSNTTGSYNIGVGGSSLYTNTTGSRNTALGYGAETISTTGNDNTSLGYFANAKIQAGSRNTSIGSNVNVANETGSDNTMIGYFAGAYNSGSANVFLGSQAGYNETGSNKLYISNSSTSSPLIYGDFSTKKIVINDSLQSKYFKMTNGASNGFVLQSDANGNGSWAALSGSSLITAGTGLSYSSSTLNSVWTTSGSNIYSNNSSNVGIGTTSPSSKLYIKGVSTYGTLAIEGSTYTSHFNYGADNSEDTYIRGGKSTSRVVVNDNSSGNTVIATGGGNVGIGTTSPSYKLQVKGTVKADSINTTYLKMTNGAASGYVLQSDASGNGTWVLSTSLSNGNWTTSGTNQYSALSGNVGIGTSSPSYKLHVSGTARADTLSASQIVESKLFKLTYGAADGNILQSDASGNASWVVKESIGYWKSDGTNQISTVSGNVGIGLGATTPAYKLQVGGTAAADSINTSYFKMSNGASNGYVLQSDVSGNAKWVTKESVANWKSDGTNQYSTVSGNVGIGTSSPASSLDIQGSVGFKVTAVTTGDNSTTLGSSDYSIIYSGSVINNSVVLPAAGSYAGRVYLIVNHSSGNITISAYYTANSTTSTSVDAGNTVQLMSDGINWHKIN